MDLIIMDYLHLVKFKIKLPMLNWNTSKVLKEAQTLLEQEIQFRVMSWFLIKISKKFKIAIWNLQDSHSQERQVLPKMNISWIKKVITNSITKFKIYTIYQLFQRNIVIQDSIIMLIIVEEIILWMEEL